MYLCIQYILYTIDLDCKKLSFHNCNTLNSVECTQIQVSNFKIVKIGENGEKKCVNLEFIKYKSIGMNISTTKNNILFFKWIQSENQ